MLLQEWLDDKYEAGHASGLQEGEAIGLEKGIVKYLLKNPSAKAAADIFGMSDERIRRLAADNKIKLTD